MIYVTEGSLESQHQLKGHPPSIFQINELEMNLIDVLEFSFGAILVGVVCIEFMSTLHKVPGARNTCFVSGYLLHDQSALNWQLA